MRDVKLIGIDWDDHTFGGTITDHVHETVERLDVTFLSTPFNNLHLEVLTPTQEVRISMGNQQFIGHVEVVSITTRDEWTNHVELKVLDLKRLPDNEEW